MKLQTLILLLIALVCAILFLRTTGCSKQSKRRNSPHPSSRARSGAKEPLRVCFDAEVPGGPQHTIVAKPDGKVHAISPKGKAWPNGSTIRMTFVDGSQYMRDMVMRVAPEWTKYANINFEFVSDPNAEIRISFSPGMGAWSYVGTDNLNPGIRGQTMNLDSDWVDEATILHEFGHMLGLAHEHQNPNDSPINWNVQQVIRDLGGPPNNWSEQQTRQNVIERYSVDQVNGTSYDSKSIMVYFFPSSWTTDGTSQELNSTISATDKAFIAGNYMYPGRD